MANKKFSEFVLKTSTSGISHIVGYNGSENVQITPANFVTTGGTGVFLPLAGGIMVGNTTHNDNVKSIYGTGTDLSIFHDGSNSYIQESGTGNLYLKATSLILSNSAGSNYLIGNSGGSVNMYYNGSQKLGTTSSGISVTGGGVFTGSITANSGSKITSSSADTTFSIETTSGTTIFPILDFVSSHSTVGGQIRQGGAQVIGFDKSLNSTFGGDVSLGNVKKLKFGLSSDASLQWNNTNNEFEINTGADASEISITAGTTNTYTSEIQIGARSSAQGEGIFFKTRSAEKMRLDGSGNLGIGTSSYSNRLQVTGGSIGIDSEFMLRDNKNNTIFRQSASTLALNRTFTIGNSSYTNIIIPNGKVSVGTPVVGQLGVRGTTDDSSGFSFESANSSGASLFAVRNDGLAVFPTSSNVGIGTATPAYKTSIKQEGDFNGSQVLLDLSLRDIVGGGYNAGTGGGISFSSSHWSQSTTEKIMGSIFGANSDGGSGANGYLSFRTRASDTVTEKMRITSGGEVLISASSYSDAGNNISLQQGLVKIGSATTSTTISMYFTNPNGVVGSISTTGSATAFSTSSDYRLKEDLQDFKGLDLVSKIPVYDYKWKAEDSRSYGVMAHELAEVLPDAVTGDKDAEEMQGVDYSKIVPLLVKSIQELSAKLEALECQCEKK